MTNVLILTGIILLILGLFLKFKIVLPGDILIKKENFVFYFPIATSIVISLAITILIWLINRFK